LIDAKSMLAGPKVQQTHKDTGHHILSRVLSELACEAVARLDGVGVILAVDKDCASDPNHPSEEWDVSERILGEADDEIGQRSNDQAHVEMRSMIAGPGTNELRMHLCQYLEQVHRRL
jgi:hypothetical protein